MTMAAGNLAGHAAEKDKDKEKPGMRRALGRGLASLLPGPRAVTPATAATGSHAAPHSAAHAPSAAVSADSSSSVEAQIDSAAGTQAQPPAPHVAELRPLPPTEVSHAPIESMPAGESRISGNVIANLAITDIDRNPFQTRHVQDDEALQELANSIKAQGVVQPILVRPSDEGDGRYVLIVGERRLLASKKAGKTHIPAMVRKVSAQQAAEMTIIENLQREDLSPLEQAQAFRVLSTEFSMTQHEIGDRVGLSRASVANYLRLLKLPQSVMDMLANRVINFAQAKELLKLEDNERIAEAAAYAVKKGMSLEQIEVLVLRMEGLLDPLPDMPGVKKREKTGGGARWVDPNVRAAQMDLERTLGLRVRIRDRKGKGKIVIEYATVDDYDRVVEMLRAKR